MLPVGMVILYEYSKVGGLMYSAAQRQLDVHAASAEQSCNNPLQNEGCLL